MISSAISCQPINRQQHFPSNIVYTYFDDIGVGDSELLESWKESWKRNGWTPIVLDKSVSMKHPFYPLLYERFNRMPSVNPKEYEMSCYLRWIAMAVVGGGFLSDYDTLNIDFLPPDNIGPEFTIYQGATPALVSGSLSEYERVLNELALFEIDPKIHTFNGQPHVSDMVMFVKLRKQGKISTTYNLTAVDFKLVHLSNDAVEKYKTKHNIDKLDKKDLAKIILKKSKQEAKRFL